MKEFTVKFTPGDRSIRVPQGTDILTAAIKCGIAIHTPCGGEGVCGKCRVIVKKGEVRPDLSRLVTSEERKRGIVLACESIIESDVEIEIPLESLEVHEKLSHEAEEFTKGRILVEETKVLFSPLVRKVYLELTRPSQDDTVSDLDRVCAALGPKIDNVLVSTKLASIKHLSEILKESDYKVTVTLGHRDGALDILAVEPGDTSKSNYGFAFDIGTTTVVGQLIDLRNKDILGSRIAFNKQACYGSDIISRIICATEAQGLEKLNDAVLDNIDEIIEDLVAENKVNLSDINAVTCAGNMTMMHLLLKIDPSNIRKAPYIPTSTSFATMHTGEVGIESNPKALASFLPGVSTYIGGDIVSGVLACGFYKDDEVSLLADIGTNGEIVLGNKDWIIGSAASAGPAFEGSGLASGMKAVKGAIEKIEIDKDLGVRAQTIGGDKPKGICGSGYIDLLCQMLKRGIIGKDGKIDRTIRSKRIRKNETNYEFVVVFKSETAIGKDIVIQEDDIENLKRAKGAIYSAIISLMNKVDIKLKDIKKIYIAGGFGNYLNIENSIFIGLLPDTSRVSYEFVGNSSLAGARMCLLSHESFKKSESIAKNITYLDLSSEPGYMDEYIASLFFPHTDLGRFPSVRL